MASIYPSIVGKNTNKQSDKHFDRKAEVVSINHLVSACASVDKSKCENCHAHGKAFCARLEGDDLAAIGDMATNRKIEAGQSLFVELDDAKQYFTVRSGCVRLSHLLADGKRQIIGFKTVGDFIGYDADGLYTCDAEAVSDTVVCQLPKALLDREIENSGKLQGQLLEMTKNSLVRAEEHNVLLGRKSPHAKLCSFLLNLMRTEGSEILPDRVELLMSRHDIADYLGLTIETVSRTFTKLRCQQVIDLPDSHTVVIIDEDMLCDIAEGV
jgi:CRP/FNR family transcriptional regulator, anaerobic regulatory protein